MFLPERGGFSKKSNSIKLKASGKHIAIVLGGMVCCILLVSGLYTILDAVGGTDANLQHRGIDTPLKQLFGGYLGPFFKMEYVGNINWLAIPVLGFLVLTWKQRKRTEQAFLVLFTLTLGVIMLKGYFNFRYMITLLPITMTIILYYVWQLFERPTLLPMRKWVFLFLAVLVGFNFYRYSPLVKLLQPTPQTENIAEKSAVSEEEKVDSKKITQQPTTTASTSKSEVLLQMFSTGQVPHLKHNRQYYLDRSNARGLTVEYLDNLQTTGNVLCNNLPLIYKYTDKRAVYYWCEDDFYYDATGPKYLFQKRTLDEVWKFVQEELSCTHIFTFDAYNAYSDTFDQFLKNYCVLEFQDKDGHQVYKIKTYNSGEATTQK